jgi:hypothetical protein
MVGPKKPNAVLNSGRLRLLCLVSVRQAGAARKAMESGRESADELIGLLLEALYIRRT